MAIGRPNHFTKILPKVVAVGDPFAIIGFKPTEDDESVLFREARG
jgi:hypothetical protein